MNTTTKVGLQKLFEAMNVEGYMFVGDYNLALSRDRTNCVIASPSTFAETGIPESQDTSFDPELVNRTLNNSEVKTEYFCDELGRFIRSIEKLYPKDDRVKVTFSGEEATYNRTPYSGSIEASEIDEEAGMKTTVVKNSILSLGKRMLYPLKERVKVSFSNDFPLVLYIPEIGIHWIIAPYISP